MSLIGCITGPDFETAKTQIHRAAEVCDGVEFRADLLQTEIPPLLDLATGITIITGLRGCLQSHLKKTHFVPDYLTLEWNDPEECINPNIKIIRAYHNFDETPEDLDAILQAMSMYPADIYKIACYAKTTTDALRMLCFVKGKTHVIGICMGPFGQITRLLGFNVGSVFQYCALGNGSAPGQLQAEEMPRKKYAKVFGLIGNPVSQSPSHRTHNDFFKENKIDAIYVKMLLQEWELPQFFSFAQHLFHGLSVTIPFKEKLFPYIDFLEKEAKEIQAVNTLTFSEKGIYGANTDAKASLEGIQVEEKEIIILGAGGAARAICYEAKRRGALVTILSRRIIQAKTLAQTFNCMYGTFNELRSCDLLINTTPNPNPVSLIHTYGIVMDITLSHKESNWLKKAKELDFTVITGEKFFERQALAQFSKWLQMSYSPEYFSLPHFWQLEQHNMHH